MSFHVQQIAAFTYGRPPRYNPRTFWGCCVTSEPVRVNGLFRLREDVELDVGAYQLRRGGGTLNLERIPMELLLLLAENAGRLITREQIVERIWGKGVFLDTDNSINGAMRKIRQALKDDPEKPRFIQTIKGKGYRLIAPVEVIGSSAPLLPATSGAAASPNDVQVNTPALAPAGFRLFGSPWLAVALAFLLLFGFATATLLTRLRAPISHSIPTRTMLAVLPFANLTGDSSQQYLADGITEEMITRLGRVDPDRISVIAPTSVMKFSRKRPSLEQVGRELAAQYVLQGSVRRDSDRVRVSAQLSRVRDGSQIWACDYDRGLKDLLLVQAEIAEEVADEVQLTVAGDRNSASSPRRLKVAATSAEAHDLYLEGRYFWDQRSREGFLKAVQWFEKAKAKDPVYAPVYAGLADAYTMMSTYGYAPAEDYMPKAREAAIKALQLDDSIAEAHTSLALIAETYDWDWQTAEKEFRRAIELDPSYATAHQWYAEALAYQGRFDEALAESRKARQLDPLSVIVAADNGAILYYARQYDRAIERFRGVLEMAPTTARAHLIIAAYIENGQIHQAFGELEKWGHEAPGPWVWANYALIYTRTGERSKATRALRKIPEMKLKFAFDPAPAMAVAYAGMNDKEHTLVWLEKAYRLRSSLLTSLKVDPVFDFLRGDPRFNDLLSRVRLQPGAVVAAYRSGL